MSTELLTRPADEIMETSRDIAVQYEPSVMSIIASAVKDPRFDVEKLERLMAMKERLDAQKAERELDSALREFRRGLPQIRKGRAVNGKGKDADGNPIVMYRYANLEDVKAVVDPRLDATDLSYSWDAETVNGITTTTCIVRHAGGGKRSARFASGQAGAPAMNSAQAAGSTASYGQRYSLLAVLGISADLDDDGRGANALPKPEHDANAPVVPTRSERANEMPHPEQAADPNRVTAAQVTALCKEYWASLSPNIKPTKEMFVAWAKDVLKIDADLGKPSNWTLDCLESCRQNIDQPM